MSRYVWRSSIAAALIASTGMITAAGTLAAGHAFAGAAPFSLAPMRGVVRQTAEPCLTRMVADSVDRVIVDMTSVSIGVVETGSVSRGVAESQYTRPVAGTGTCYILEHVDRERQSWGAFAPGSR